MDVGIYSIQSAEMIAGAYPIAVSAMTNKTDPVKFKDVEESMTFELKFPNGISAYVQTTYKVNGINRTTAYRRARLVRAHAGVQLRRQQAAGAATTSRSSARRVDQFATEMDNFADCIINNRPTSVPGEMGLRDVRTMMAHLRGGADGSDGDALRG